MRLGILGGTFNPIHVGHLILAECARQQYALDQVWFVPAAKPPHKSSRSLLDGRVRLELIRLAIRGNPSFRASDVELKLAGVSYTIRTVRLLQERYPNAKLFLIVGSDMLGVRWYGLKTLLRLCTFLVAPRPTSQHARHFAGMKRIAMPTVDVSSSMIRTRIRRDESIRYIVPDAAARYIVRHRLYR